MPTDSKGKPYPFLLYGHPEVSADLLAAGFTTASDLNDHQENSSVSIRLSDRNGNGDRFSSRHNPMITSLKKVLLPGLLYAITAGASLCDAETQIPPPTSEGNPDGSAAKIIEVDTTKRTVTLQAKGANHLFFLNPHVVDTRTHQQITLDQLANGEFISFVTRPRADGQLEIVSLMILHHESGRPSGGGIHGGPVDVSPFN